MARIGVIVPVYNVEAYLERCVRSILCQSHRDLKLVLVDDGSPDNSGVLCDGFGARDSRIHVIHQKNGGLSAARNAGLDYLEAAGDCQWVMFIDSDDWIHPKMLERMLRAAEDTGTGISLCAYRESQGGDIWTGEETFPVTAWDSSEYYRKNLVNATIACCKLYGLDCFRGIRFPLGKIHEDEFVTYRLLLEQKTLAVVEEPLYAYFVNPAGITKSGWKVKRLDAWEAFEQQLLFFKEHNFPELTQFRLREYLENALVNLRGAEESDQVPQETIRFMKKRIRSLIRRCWHGGCIQFQYDFAFLVRFYPLTTKLYRFVLEMKEK